MAVDIAVSDIEVISSFNVFWAAEEWLGREMRNTKANGTIDPATGIPRVTSDWARAKKKGKREIIRRNC
jgi:hypothetical protein